jgi:2'-5' RNA ligase
VSENKVSRVRLFFALWPDAGTRAHIAAAASSLSLPADARAAARDNYHLTLSFIGDVPVAQIEVLQRIGRQQRAGICAIKFDAYEYWPKPEVVVAAAREIPPALDDFWRQLHGDLADSQLALNPKRLRPHITLARKVSQAPVLQAMSSFIWEAREFCLVRSDTSGAQSVYTVLDTWPLLDETSNA